MIHEYLDEAKEHLRHYSKQALSEMADAAVAMVAVQRALEEKTGVVPFPLATVAQAAIQKYREEIIDEINELEMQKTEVDALVASRRSALEAFDEVWFRLDK